VSASGIFALALSTILVACTADTTRTERQTEAPITNTPSVTQNEKIACNYFVSKGLTKFQAAGIVGNLDQESGVNPTSQQQGGGPGRGIAQWEVGTRWDTSPGDNAVAFANQRGQDVWSLQLQLDFIWYELTSIGYGYSALRQTTNVTDATVVFERNFEICNPTYCDESQRIAYAEAVLPSCNGGGGASETRPFELVRQRSQAGQIDVFYPAGDGHGTLHMAYNDGGGWNDFALCGGRWSTGPLSAVEDDGGTVRVYYHDPGDDLLHECWRNPSNGQWTDGSFGRPIDGGTTAFSADGITHVFYHAPGSAPEIWESYLDGGGWHHHSLGRWAQGTPYALKTLADGNTNVLYHDAGDHLLHLLWWSPSSGWSDYNSGLPISNSPVAYEALRGTPTNLARTLRVYYAGNDANHSMHEYSWSPNTGAWSDWNTGFWMVAGTSAAVTQDFSGAVNVFYDDPGAQGPSTLFDMYLDASTWHRPTTGLTGGTRWMSGSAFAVTQPSGHMSVIFRDSGSGRVNELWYDGAWHLNDMPWSMAP
jgi:hypothetical protein